jgi:hypothetical protein
MKVYDFAAAREHYQRAKTLGHAQAKQRLAYLAEQTGK